MRRKHDQGLDHNRPSGIHPCVANTIRDQITTDLRYPSVIPKHCQGLDHSRPQQTSGIRRAYQTLSGTRSQQTSTQTSGIHRAYQTLSGTTHNRPQVSAVRTKHCQGLTTDLRYPACIPITVRDYITADVNTPQVSGVYPNHCEGLTTDLRYPACIPITVMVR